LIQILLAIPEGSSFTFGSGGFKQFKVGILGFGWLRRRRVELAHGECACEADGWWWQGVGGGHGFFLKVENVHIKGMERIRNWMDHSWRLDLMGAQFYLHWVLWYSISNCRNGMSQNNDGLASNTKVSVLHSFLFLQQ